MDKLKKDGVIHDTITGYDFTKDEPLPKPKAMRTRCLECAGSPAAVRKCKVTDCAFWKFRHSSPEKPDTRGQKLLEVNVWIVRDAPHRGSENVKLLIVRYSPIEFPTLESSVHRKVRNRLI